MTQRFNEYDVVEIVRLGVNDRSFQGSEGIARAPAVGDVATIVTICDPNDRAGFILEMVADDGRTVLLADFSADELRVVWTA